MSALPGSEHFQSAPPERYWWVAEDDKPKGPYHEAYLIAAVRMGVFHPDDQACPANGTVWKSLADWPAFAPACAAGSATAGTPPRPAVAAGPAASSVPTPPPPRGTAVNTPVPPVATPRASGFSLTPLAGLIVGGAVGALLGLAIGALIGVGMHGGCLMGAVTGALAGAWAATGRKSDKPPPAQ